MRRRMTGLWRSLWLRVALTVSVALAATLAAVVVTVYELTLLTERRALDELLIAEGDTLADTIEAAITASDTVDLTDLEVIATRGLAANPGSSLHLALVRFGETVVSSARGPERLERLRDDGLLPSSPPGMLISVNGVRSRAVELRLGNLTLTVETLGDDRAITDEAGDVASRTATAALIGGLFGVIGIAIVVRRSTRGIGQIAATARATRLDDLTARVPEQTGTNEVTLLARDVNAMLDDLAAARSAKDELVALVSHELRTPLAAARGHTELLAAGTASDPADTVHRIERELGRLTRLVDDLLALSRAGDPAWLARRLVRAGEIIEELRHRLASVGADGVEFGAVPDVVIDVDADRVLQALSNLIDNAIIHTPAGTHVVVTTAVGTDGVVFTVTDDGPGLPESVRRHAGTAFVRGSRTGTGLGLAVSRAVAVAHGGSLEIDSGTDGTRIGLRLPVD